MSEAEAIAQRYLLRAMMDLLKEEGWAPYGTHEPTKTGELEFSRQMGIDGRPLFERLMTEQEQEITV